MNKIFLRIMVIVGLIGLYGMIASQSVCAVDTNILSSCGAQSDDSNGGGIWCLLNIILTVLTFGVVTLATLGLIISGAQYISSADNPERMAKAKNRIINVLIGLAAYAVMWAALNWLLPGGIFH